MKSWKVEAAIIAVGLLLLGIIGMALSNKLKVIGAK